MFPVGNHQMCSEMIPFRETIKLGAPFRGYHFVQPTAKRRRFPCGNPHSLMALSHDERNWNRAAFIPAKEFVWIYPLAKEIGIERLLSPLRNLYGFYPLAKEIEWLLSLQMKSDGFYPRSGDNPNLAVG